MSYYKIKAYPLINDVDTDKVEHLMQSMLDSGWHGAPILFCDTCLITGSHRLQALKNLDNMYYDVDSDIQDKIDRVLCNDAIAINVTDIINEYCVNNDCDIDFSSLGNIFAGTWVEQYKNEIEW